MKKVNVAGLNIDAITKTELLTEVLAHLKNNQKTFITTPYSEFLYHSLLNPKDEHILNSADFAVADGIGILWAAKFLSVPLKTKKYLFKIAETFWQAFWTLCLIILKPSSLKQIIPEKIVGADLIWDLSELATKNNFSIFLLGGFGDTPKIVAQNIQAKFPNLQIAGYSNKNPEDPTIYDDINKASPDMLFVAYGPIKQERWIAQNLPNLPVKLAVGIGGTFDYIAKITPLPPKFVRLTGLEWLWRLFTQPKRFHRIINATFGLVFSLIRYKLLFSYPYRKNVIGVVLNKKHEILIAKRNPKKFSKNFILPEHFEEYWQLPQGGIEPNENIVNAGQREVSEETGLSNLKFLSISSQTHSYIWRHTVRPILIASKFRYKGQEQTICYFLFDGNESDVKIDAYEFIDYKWVPIEKLALEMHEERFAVASIVKQDLKEMQEKGII